MNEGARCSRVPPRVVSSRATKERLSWRNSIEQTVSSSSSSRTGRAVGMAFGFAGGPFPTARAGFASLDFLFGAGLDFGFAARLGLDTLRGFRAIVAGIRQGD